jgi:hemoglobin
MAWAMQDNAMEPTLQERLLQSFYETADWMRNRPD